MKRLSAAAGLAVVVLALAGCGGQTVEQRRDHCLYVAMSAYPNYRGTVPVLDVLPACRGVDVAPLRTLTDEFVQAAQEHP